MRRKGRKGGEDAAILDVGFFPAVAGRAYARMFNFSPQLRDTLTRGLRKRLLTSRSPGTRLRVDCSRKERKAPTRVGKGGIFNFGFFPADTRNLTQRSPRTQRGVIFNFGFFPVVAGRAYARIFNWGRDCSRKGR